MLAPGKQKFPGIIFALFSVYSIMADIINTQAGDASWTDTFYSLNRGNVDTELQRLDANHFNVWLPLTGQVAPTHILDQLNQASSPRVADVATGNGV